MGINEIVLISLYVVILTKLVFTSKLNLNIFPVNTEQRLKKEFILESLGRVNCIPPIVHKIN